MSGVVCVRYHVGLVNQQLRAMVAGYNSVAPAGRTMSYTAYLSASLSGDLDDLCAPGLFNCTKVCVRVCVWGGGSVSTR